MVPIREQTEVRPRDISVVIPIFNEAQSLSELHARLRETLSSLQATCEIIFVDDGSDDQSFAVLQQLSQQDSKVLVIRLRKHFGKSAALAAGFDLATGAIIITMDGDLQDSPEEVPRFIEKLHAGYDLVSGWKSPRHDPLSKTIPSRIFNLVTAKVTGLPLNDINCGFKAYRKELLQGICVYGELHRYLPVFAHARGYRVTEIKVQHYPRRHGKSKFGLERFARGLLDLLTVTLLTTYSRRPLHLFGSVGLLAVMSGLFLALYLFGNHCWYLLSGDPRFALFQTRPLLTFAALLLTIGLNFIFTGLLAELVINLGAYQQRDKPYTIDSLTRYGTPQTTVRGHDS